jgi:hypothetical protein
LSLHLLLLSCLLLPRLSLQVCCVDSVDLQVMMAVAETTTTTTRMKTTRGRTTRGRIRQLVAVNSKLHRHVMTYALLESA